MRLLYLYTLEFKEFFESDIPRYAILSHRWGDNEVTYKDMRRKRAAQGPGLRKILDFCSFARQQRARKFQEGFEYLEWGWVDTACINKDSSAELSEAINSMYEWYSQSSLCCVYLADVPYPSDTSPPLQLMFEQSEWFRRGWTLQEMLAPRRLLYCSAEWKPLVQKGSQMISGPSLDTEVSGITGVAVKYLDRSLDLSTASIACRMSWAAHRRTSRVEDIAYSLLGLFGVHMPIIYGEGRNAFRRLQEGLILRSSDQSIFAWQPSGMKQDESEQEADGVGTSSVFAESPDDFASAGNITTRVRSLFARPSMSRYNMSQGELELRCKARKGRRDFPWGDLLNFWVIDLDCEDAGQPCHLVIAEAQESPVLVRITCSLTAPAFGPLGNERQGTFYLQAFGGDRGLLGRQFPPDHTASTTHADTLLWLRFKALSTPRAEFASYEGTESSDAASLDGDADSPRVPEFVDEAPDFSAPESPSSTSLTPTAAYLEFPIKVLNNAGP